jgi:hypothetical protein
VSRPNEEFPDRLAAVQICRLDIPNCLARARQSSRIFLHACPVQNQLLPVESVLRKEQWIFYKPNFVTLTQPGSEWVKLVRIDEKNHRGDLRGFVCSTPQRIPFEELFRKAMLCRYFSVGRRTRSLGDSHQKS